MAPKLSDADTTEGESTDLETTGSMEASTEEEDSLTPRHRKADMFPDSGSSDADTSNGENIDLGTTESTEDDDCLTPRKRKAETKTMILNGIDICAMFTALGNGSGVRPFSFDAKFLMPNITGREYIDNMVKLALDRYNQENQTNVACDHVVKSHGQTEHWNQSLPQGDLIEYHQAKTQWKVWQRNSHVIFCRPAPPREILSKDDRC